MGPNVQATSIRAPLLRSFVEANLLVRFELTIDTEASTSTRHWAYLEHGKYFLPVRDTREASIPRSVVEASTQMSLSSFALQADTYNNHYNYN